jgi:THO complex subunit 4
VDTQDFFVKAVGSLRKVSLAFGPDGRSRGEATVIFSDSTKAAEALEKFNGVKVDNRPMRVRKIGIPYYCPSALISSRLRSWAVQRRQRLRVWRIVWRM